MSNVSRRSLLALSALAPFAGRLSAGGAAGRFSSGASSPRQRLQELHFPNVILRTHENKPVRFYDDLLKDKIVTLNYMYTQCGEVCPLTTHHLVRVQKLLGDRVGREIFMYSLTLDPNHDTPGVLKKYMAMHGVAPGWQFLTGKYEDLELLRRKLGLIDPDPKVDKDRTNHIGTVIYGNEPLMLWSACPSLANPEWIVKEISWAAQLDDLRFRE